MHSLAVEVGVGWLEGTVGELTRVIGTRIVGEFDVIDESDSVDMADLVDEGEVADEDDLANEIVVDVDAVVTVIMSVLEFSYQYTVEVLEESMAQVQEIYVTPLPISAVGAQ